jgi:hypothetical protein
VLATEQRCLFAYWIADIERASAEAAVQIAEFVGCLSVRSGFPNDEVLHGHPLWGSGLVHYEAHEIVESPWLAEVRAIELCHPMSSAQPFIEAKHFLLAFHDSTLEALARDVRMVGTSPSMVSAIARMAGIQG